MPSTFHTLLSHYLPCYNESERQIRSHSETEAQEPIAVLLDNKWPQDDSVEKTYILTRNGINRG